MHNKCLMGFDFRVMRKEEVGPEDGGKCIN